MKVYNTITGVVLGMVLAVSSANAEKKPQSLSDIIDSSSNKDGEVSSSVEAMDTKIKTAGSMFYTKEVDEFIGKYRKTIDGKIHKQFGQAKETRRKYESNSHIRGRSYPSGSSWSYCIFALEDLYPIIAACDGGGKKYANHPNMVRFRNELESLKVVMEDTAESNLRAYISSRMSVSSYNARRVRSQDKSKYLQRERESAKKSLTSDVKRYCKNEQLEARLVKVVGNSL